MTGNITAMTSADGTRIAYELHGDGPGVVIVDGAMCFRASGPAHPLCAQLDDDFTVLLYDRRGRGESTDSTGNTAGATEVERGSADTDAEPRSARSVERELDDLDQLVETLVDATGSGCSAPALIGISSGAALALHAAARIGDRVSAVVVYEPPYMPEPLAAGARAYTQSLGDALAAGDRDQAVSLFLSRAGTPAEALEGIRRSPAWPGMTALAPTLAYDDAAMGDSRVPADLVASIGAPVLALAGGASPDMMQFGAREVADAARNGEFDLLDGQGHDADPGVLAARIREFLRR